MKEQDKGLVLSCLGFLFWAVSTFFLTAVFFNTCVDINDDLELDILLSVVIGFVGLIVLGLTSEKNIYNRIQRIKKYDFTHHPRLPQFTLSALSMMAIYSIVALLIVGFSDIEPFSSQQLGKKVLIYIVYCGFAIIVDILESKGKITTISSIDE